MRLRSYKPQPKHVIAVGILLVLLALAVYELQDVIVNFWPTEGAFASARKQLKREQSTYQESLNEAARLQAWRDRFHSRAADFWLSARDGAPETQAQSKVQQAAQRAGVELTTIGNPRQTNVGEGISLFELSVETMVPIEKLTDFLAEIYSSKPAFHWQSLTLRPEAIRKPDNVKLAGRLRVLTITDSQAVAFLVGKEAGKADPPKESPPPPPPKPEEPKADEPKPEGGG